MLKMICIVMILLTALYPGLSHAQGAAFRQAKYYKSEESEVITPADATAPLTYPGKQSAFSVSIPVSKGDIVEVTFESSIHGNAYFTIASTGAACAENHNMRLLSNWYNQPDRVYNVFTLKAVFTATQSGTATFKMQFWQEAVDNIFHGNYKDVWLYGLMAYAEVVSLPS